MKKTTKRIIALMMALTLIIVMLTGCGQANGIIPDVEVGGTTVEEVITSALGKLAEIALAVVSIIALCWAKTYIIPWLKERGLLRNIKKGVKAAEQLAKKGDIPDDGDAKNTFVKGFLQEIGIQITSWVDTMIEAEVYELKNNGIGALAALAGEEIVPDEPEADPDDLASSEPEPVDDETEEGAE